MVRISVCIASVGRPSLARTLRSVLDAQLSSEFELEVIVADDSSNGQATKIAWEAAGAAVRCIAVGSRNISTARNACLEHATGEYLAFIDDDEWSDASWLPLLFGCAECFRADAVFGPIEPIYPKDIPDWMRKAGLFRKIKGPRGKRVRTGATGNALVRRASIEERNLRFCEDFGNSGGEDTDFFARLDSTGGYLIETDDAVVFTEIAPERLSTKYLRRRYLRSGQTYAKITTRSSFRAKRLAFYVVATSKLAIAAFISVLLRPIRRDKSFSFRIRTWRYLGMLFEAIGRPLPAIY